MANTLGALMQQPRRSFGFQSPQGALFDERNQLENISPNTLAMLSSGKNFIETPNGMVDLSQMQQAPMQQRGSPVEVYGQGRGYLQPDGTIIGTNQQGQQFMVQPEGTNDAQIKARIAAEDRAMKIQEFEQKMKGPQETPSDRLAREKFEWEKSKATTESKKLDERTQTATDALGIAQKARAILEKGDATGSGVGAGVDWLAGQAGYATEGAKASAALKALGGALVAKMPKMSGPQSDKDVLLYREMAGQVADSTLPIETRLAALSTVEDLQRMYGGKDQSAQSNAPEMPQMPNPQSATGRTVRDTSTGIRYKSDGSRWVRVE